MTNGAGHHDDKKKAPRKKPQTKKARTARDGARATLTKGVKTPPPAPAS